MPVDSRILVVGSHAPGLFLRVDHIPRAGETVVGWDYQEPMDGGKGSNQAIAAARLNARVSFVGCLGKDRIGEAGELWMRDAGVDLTYIQRHPSVPSGIGFNMLDRNGVPAMVTSMGANNEIRIEDIAAALDGLPGIEVMLTQWEIPPDIALEAARMARDQGITTIINPAPAMDMPLEKLGVATILVPNEIEAATLLGIPVSYLDDPLAVAHQLRNATEVECTLITLGEKGVAGAMRTGESWWIKPPVVQVVDTSGAGDAFCAGLAVFLAEGKSIRQSAEWATAAAALSVTRPGTIPAYPTWEEVNSFIHSYTPEFEDRGTKAG
jgi:ribokinase